MTNVVKFPGSSDDKKSNVFPFPAPSNERKGDGLSKNGKATKKTKVSKRGWKAAARPIFNFIRVTIAMALQIVMVAALSVLYGLKGMITLVTSLGMCAVYYSEGITYVTDAKGHPATVYTFIACGALIALAHSGRTIAKIIILKRIAFFVVGR
jgi:hypothetical protein